MMLLTGTFSRSIDEKHRVAIPKRLRDAVQSTEGEVLYLAPGTDKSLAIYTEDEFAKLAGRVSAMSPTRPDVRAFTRLFFTSAQRVELDRQGRVRIPKELVAWAELAKEVTLLGVQNHMELWSSDVWTAYQADRQAHYDELAETALGGGP